MGNAFGIAGIIQVRRYFTSSDEVKSLHGLTVLIPAGTSVQSGKYDSFHLQSEGVDCLISIHVLAHVRQNHGDKQ